MLRTCILASLFPLSTAVRNITGPSDHFERACKSWCTLTGTSATLNPKYWDKSMARRWLLLLVLVLGVVLVGAPATQAAQVRLASVASPTYFVWVPARRHEMSKLKRVVAKVLVRRSNGNRYFQVGAFRDSSNAQNLVAELKQRGFAAFMRTQPTTVPLRIAALAMIPAPSVTPVSLDLPVIPVAHYTPMTRVLVLARDFEQTPGVQQLTKGTFRRQWQGQNYIQVGAFSQEENLKQMISELDKLGVTSVVQRPS